MGRTVMEIAPTIDPWPVIDAWANDWRYSLKAHGPWGRRYQHGDGFAIAPVCVQFEPLPNGLRLSAWVPVLGFRMAGVPLGFGMDRPIDSGGYVGSVQKKVGRDHVNELLRRLGAPTL